MDRQELQPSVPQKQIEYNFDDSFSGGCSIKLRDGADQAPRRLFVVDWKLEYGLIVAYAFKAVVPGEDVSVWLRVESSDGEISTIECGASDNSDEVEVKEVHRRLLPLSECDQLPVIRHLRKVNEDSLPTSAPNDWEIRYYYLSIRNDVADTARLTDIGIGTDHGVGTYVGAVRVNRGSEDLRKRLSAK